MFRSTILTAVCACVLISVSPVRSQDDRPERSDQPERPERRGDRPVRGEGRGRPPLSREEMLKRFDADGDGELSEAERETLRETMRREFGDRGRRPGGPGGFACE